MNGEVIIQNLLPQLQAWWPTIRLISLLIGFAFVVVGIIGVTSDGRQGGIKAKGPLSSIVAGILLLNIISLLNTLAQSFFASNSETGLSYAAPGGSDPTALYITFAVYIVMLVGLFGVIYGGILIKRSADDGRQLGPAITHLIGGTLGVNIVTFLHILASSMGPSVESAISNLIG